MNVTHPNEQQPAATHRDWNAIAQRLAGEERLTVAQAAKLVPSNASRRGYCSANALVKWIIVGKYGVYLDAVRAAGKTWWTSREALSRFMAAVSEAATAKQCADADAGDAAGSVARRSRDAIRRLELLRKRS
jgi:hypothetical protein